MRRRYRGEPVLAHFLITLRSLFFQESGVSRYKYQMLYRWISSAFVVMIAAPASAEDQGVSVTLSFPKTSFTATAPGLPSTNGLPALQCDDKYCGFASTRDLWKLDLPKPVRPDDMNTESVFAERAHLLAAAKRWADSPPVFQIALPGTNCALGGYRADDMFGIGCGSQHRKLDPRFVCVDRKSCTPTEEHDDDRP
jgi:hypothetical protein